MNEKLMDLLKGLSESVKVVEVDLPGLLGDLQDECLHCALVKPVELWLKLHPAGDTQVTFAAAVLVAMELLVVLEPDEDKQAQLTDWLIGQLPGVLAKVQQDVVEAKMKVN